jgi:outer membrane protein assembly factor BamB
MLRCGTCQYSSSESAIEARVCWETPLTRPQENTHTSAQPLINSGMVFLDADGMVFGVNLANGHQRWRWNSGARPLSGSSGGGNATISVADSLVLATGQQGNRREVVGMDEAKGSVRWRFTVPAGSLSLVATNDGGLAVSGYSGTVTQVVRDQDGRTRWSQPARPPTQVAGGLIQISPLGTTAFGNDLLENVQNGVEAFERRTVKSIGPTRARSIRSRRLPTFSFDAPTRPDPWTI